MVKKSADGSEVRFCPICQQWQWQSQSSSLAWRGAQVYPDRHGIPMSEQRICRIENKKLSSALLPLELKRWEMERLWFQSLPAKCQGKAGSWVAGRARLMHLLSRGHAKISHRNCTAK